jgi:hypothetical protein
MIIFQIVFWILLGLLYLGIGFPYHELIIGICALVIGIVMLAGELRHR